MTMLSKKDKTRFIETLERIDDERARYFLMMFCDAMAEYAAVRRSRAHRHGNVNTSPAHVQEITRRMNG